MTKIYEKLQLMNLDSCYDEEQDIITICGARTLLTVERLKNSKYFVIRFKQLFVNVDLGHFEREKDVCEVVELLIKANRGR